MNLEDLRRIRVKDSQRTVNKVSHHEIEAQVKAFLAKGGQIKQVPSGLSGDESLTLTVSPSMKMLEASGEGMSLRAISIMLGRSHAWITKQIQLGHGPRFTLDSKRQKRFNRDEVLKWHEAMK